MQADARASPQKEKAEIRLEFHHPGQSGR
jgi:hypothetical protein